MNGPFQYGGLLFSTSPILSTAIFPNTGMPITTGSVIDLMVSRIGTNEFFDTTAICGSITLF